MAHALIVGLASLFGGGYYVGDLDAVANGQGGAFVAGPETPAAIWYNPGALTRGRGLRLELEGGIIWCSLRYDRADDAAGTAYPRVTNAEPLQPAGFAGAVHDFGVKDLAVGLGVYSPSSNNFDFAEDGPQRFLYVSGNITLIHVHAAVAYRVHPMVSLGVALGGTTFRASQRTLVSAALDGIDPENQAFTVPTELSVSDPFTFSANLGVSVTPVPELDVPFPTVVRAGVRVRPVPRLGIELAAVFEQWSRLQFIRVTPDIIVRAPALGIDELALPVIELPKKQRDVFNLRLGGELRASERTAVRAGAWFETAGARPSVFDISTPESKKLGLAAGATFHFPRVAVDVSYSHVFADGVTVTDSENTVLNVLVPENTRSVGNGAYDYAYDIFHLGLRADL